MNNFTTTTSSGRDLWECCSPEAILVKILSGEKPSEALINNTLNVLGCLNQDGTLDIGKADREIKRYTSLVKGKFK